MKLNGHVKEPRRGPGREPADGRCRDSVSSTIPSSPRTMRTTPCLPRSSARTQTRTPPGFRRAARAASGPTSTPWAMIRSKAPSCGGTTRPSLHTTAAFSISSALNRRCAACARLRNRSVPITSSASEARIAVAKAGARADLVDVVAGLDVERLDHPREERGRGHRLPTADRQRQVAGGEVGEGRRHEEAARHEFKGAQDAQVADAARPHQQVERRPRLGRARRRFRRRRAGHSA